MMSRSMADKGLVSDGALPIAVVRTFGTRSKSLNSLACLQPLIKILANTRNAIHELQDG